MAKYRRTKIFIDRQVQGALLIRVVMYWFYCLLAVTLMLACWNVVQNQPSSSGELFRRVWLQYGPALAATMLLLPIVVLDCIRLSHKFVGPIYRLRCAMKQLANGEDVEPVKFRKGDFWYDFAEDFNAAVLGQRQKTDVPLADTSTAAASAELVEREAHQRNQIADETEYVVAKS